ncbi:hypothetical protein Hanom_Chr03g00210721 [Helianthus anomalus]
MSNYLYGNVIKINESPRKTNKQIIKLHGRIQIASNVSSPILKPRTSTVDLGKILIS